MPFARPRRSTGAVSYSGMELDSSVDEHDTSKSKGKAKKVVSDDSDFEGETKGDQSEDDEESEESESGGSSGDEARSASVVSAQESSDDEDLLPAQEEERPKARYKPRKSAAPANGDDKPTTSRTKLDESLPPIVSLRDIFKDLVGKVPGELDAVVEHLKGRKLRVGTMCSGTESPLLALGLISHALEDLTGGKLHVEHIFSCEIEPFKQASLMAYIERNFSPPLLFRDVTKMSEDQASTAYGGLADVPGDIDMLVAGTSCVDYSPLNVQKKGINAGGESGRTFFGMLDYVAKHKPTIVILENVSSAPWAQVVDKFAGIGYNATSVRLDTKQHYIPHTRVRGYLIAVPASKAKGSLCDKWADKVISLRRPASVTLEAFLLADDDPRIQRARQDLATIRQNKDGVRRAPTDWNKCESRHSRARDEEMLGQQRPCTAWVDGGGQPMMPDGAWNDWAAAQTERVTDLMDISSLRLALTNVDVQYKSAIWNLSQNVDRSTASPSLGICPCLTPNMIPYSSIRGGPIIGIEALNLQGMPVDQLVLTRENEDQLADLAGNAMSSTVVGTAIVAALCIAGKHLAVVQGDEEDDVEMNNAKPVVDSIRGHDRLTDVLIDLTACVPMPNDLLSSAHRSARKCICEGRTAVAPTDIFYCTSCGHTTCEHCIARPTHTYVRDEADRIPPTTFEAEAKTVLPMRFVLNGFDRASLGARVDAEVEGGMTVDDQLIESYLDRFGMAVDSNVEFHFKQLIRRQVWTALYEADNARLELVLDPKNPHWSLYVIADATLAVNDPLRILFLDPVARLNFQPDTTTLIDGEWSIRIPLKDKSNLIQIENTGELVQSWRASLGLPDFENEKRSNRLEISMSADAGRLVDQSLEGTYVLQPDCGTACNSLYRREQEPLVYLFLDPPRSTEAGAGPAIFSTGCHRLAYGTSRSPIAVLDQDWIANDVEGVQEVEMKCSSTWVSLAASEVEHAGEQLSEKSEFALPTKAFSVIADVTACSFAESLISGRVRAQVQDKAWATEDWYQIDLLHEGPEVFDKLNWILARIPMSTSITSWQSIDEGTLELHCKTCSPPPPSIQWMRKSNTTGPSGITAVENGPEAAQFEQALKSRPPPILVHTRQDGNFFEFKIGLNVATLAHKALHALPSDSYRSFTMSDPAVQWRLTSADGVELNLGRERKLPIFTLPNNRADDESPQPPHFVDFQLRPEQLRSLTWMIEQERNPTAWIEEEVSEAVLSQLGWHAEAKATREVLVRGGVIADEVGYGKTAITVGLISAQLASTVLPTDTDRIPVKATLIVVPAHLTKQWPSEIAKFTAESLEVIVIKDIADLKRKTIAEFQSADIVLISDSVFKSNLYWPHFGEFCASPRGIHQDPNAGRYFRTCVEESLAALPAQLARLQDPKQGSRAVLTAINACRKARSSDSQIMEEPARRLKGQAYVEAQERAKLKGGKPLNVKETKAAKPKGGPKLESDPWMLGEASVKKDWTQMQNPPLSMFSFNRLVIDEFTYLEAPQLAAVRAIRSSSRWILSGTPPMKDFAQIKTIAALLHVHLGIDDINEGTAREVTARTKEKTSAEKFHSFRDVRTGGWHDRRDQVAQKFLDHFARQNLAEIDEIEYSEELVKVKLPAAEMAIYRELEHHLLALDSNLTKLVKIDKSKRSDRELRLADALGESRSPEEALLKRCAHFSLDMDEESAALEDAPHVCDRILSTRTEQLEDCKADILALTVKCAYMHRGLLKEGLYTLDTATKKGDPQSFVLWLDEITKMGDADTEACLAEIVAGASCVGLVVSRPPQGAPKAKGMDDFNAPRSSKDSPKEYRLKKIWMLRESVHLLRRLGKELLGRFRSKRYFECVRDVQCRKIEDIDDIAILSSCGHAGPVAVVRASAKVNRCVDPSCRAPVTATNIVLATTLGLEGDSGSFGIKLQTLVDLVDQIPDSDKVLIFVQFDDLFDKVKEALESYGISTVSLSGTAKVKSSALEDFQDPESETGRVLILRVTDASASGANLTVANWAFFISPLLTDTKEQYRAYETQAIGRVRRFGQKKAVKVYRLLTSDTIDVELYETRSGLNVDKIVEEQLERNPSLKDGIPATQRPLNRITHFVPSAAKRKGKAKKHNSDDDESDAEESEEEVKPKRAPKSKAKKKVADSEAEQEVEEVVKKAAVAPKKKATPAKKVVKTAPVVEVMSKDSEDSDEVVVQTLTRKRTAKRPVSDSDDEEEVPAPATRGRRTRASAIIADEEDSSTPIASGSRSSSASKKRTLSSPVNGNAKRTRSNGSSPLKIPFVEIPPLTSSQRSSLGRGGRR